MLPQLFTQRPSGDHLEALQAIVMRVMRVDDSTRGDNENYAVRFRGQLTMDSIEAYALVAEKFRELRYTPLFRKEGEMHVVLALRGIIEPTPSRAWINYLMFGLTFLSVLYTGAVYFYNGENPPTLAAWLNGWPFLVCMLGILLAHEFGHYFAARYHKVAVTLPYFIPLPFLSPFGTMGAVIQLKSPPTNKRVLLDIGVAGPLAGFLVALPVLIYGLVTSPVEAIPLTMPTGQGIALEGNSILYVLAKYSIFHQFLPAPANYGNLPSWLYMFRYYLLGFPVPLGGHDVILNQVAWAGWAGLLVTGLNLIPVGQLDGGHAIYVLIGLKARRLVPFIIAALIGLGFFWPGWLIWAALIYWLVGRTYAEPLDQITELNKPRKILALCVLLLFILVITPIPQKIIVF